MTLIVNGTRADICQLYPSQTVGAEIGVFCGRFSKALAKGTDPKLMYLIDPWWTLHGEAYGYRPAVNTRESHAATLARMKWWIDRDRVQILVRRSQDALAEFQDAHLDWVYLDSSHQYEETCEELELCRQKVKPDGIISGHDFNTRRHPGVFRALADFLKNNRDYVLSYQDNYCQWAIQIRDLLPARWPQQSDSV